MISQFFITDETKYIRLRADTALVINSGKGLPTLPFKSMFKHYRFEEFDWLMSADFWNFLQKMCGESEDRELIFGVFSPDPVSYFKVNFGYFNWAVLSLSLSADDYWDFLNLAPSESPADSMLVNSQTITITVPSKRWVIWAERQSGLCVLASVGSHYLAAWHGIDWVTSLHSTKEWKTFSRELAMQLELNASS